jgi:hypothetical protein
LAAEYDLNIDQGATFRQNFRWEAGDPPAPVDLTGCSAELHIRARARDAQPLVAASTSNGKLTLDNAGNIHLVLSAADTAILTVKEAVYDLEITLTNGDVNRLVGGKVFVSPQVTR